MNLTEFKLLLISPTTKFLKVFGSLSVYNIINPSNIVWSLPSSNQSNPNNHQVLRI